MVIIFGSSLYEIDRLPLCTENQAVFRPIILGRNRHRHVLFWIPLSHARASQTHKTMSPIPLRFSSRWISKWISLVRSRLSPDVVRSIASKLTTSQTLLHYPQDNVLRWRIILFIIIVDPLIVLVSFASRAAVLISLIWMTTIRFLYFSHALEIECLENLHALVGTGASTTTYIMSNNNLKTSSEVAS
jgi:hypothetical protein